MKKKNIIVRTAGILNAVGEAIASSKVYRSSF